ncbi:MAG: hypothetical protein ACRC42_03020 [Mycoplasma sp.]
MNKKIKTFFISTLVIGIISPFMLFIPDVNNDEVVVNSNVVPEPLSVNEKYNNHKLFSINSTYENNFITSTDPIYLKIGTNANDELWNNAALTLKIDQNLTQKSATYSTREYKDGFKLLSSVPSNFTTEHTKINISKIETSSYEKMSKVGDIPNRIRSIDDIFFDTTKDNTLISNSPAAIYVDLQYTRNEQTNNPISISNMFRTHQRETLSYSNLNDKSFFDSNGVALNKTKLFFIYNKTVREYETSSSVATGGPPIVVSGSTTPSSEFREIRTTEFADHQFALWKNEGKTAFEVVQMLRIHGQKFFELIADGVPQWFQKYMVFDLIPIDEKGEIEVIIESNIGYDFSNDNLYNEENPFEIWNNKNGGSSNGSQWIPGSKKISLKIPGFKKRFSDTTIEPIAEKTINMSSYNVLEYIGYNDTTKSFNKKRMEEFIDFDSVPSTADIVIKTRPQLESTKASFSFEVSQYYEKGKLIIGQKSFSCTIGEFKKNEESRALVFDNYRRDISSNEILDYLTDGVLTDSTLESEYIDVNITKLEEFVDLSSFPKYTGDFNDQTGHLQGKEVLNSFKIRGKRKLTNNSIEFYLVPKAVFTEDGSRELFDPSIIPETTEQFIVKLNNLNPNKKTELHKSSYIPSFITIDNFEKELFQSDGQVNLNVLSKLIDLNYFPKTTKFTIDKQTIVKTSSTFGFQLIANKYFDEDSKIKYSEIKFDLAFDFWMTQTDITLIVIGSVIGFIFLIGLIAFAIKQKNKTKYI